MNNTSKEKKPKIKQERLALYTIDMKYIRNLHKKDDRVRSVSPQIGKASRAFLGIIVICDEHKYCIPLSHPKPKHTDMKGTIDFTKIFDEKGKLIGVLDFNMMIPVTDAQLRKLDIAIHPSDTPEIKHYKKLCQREINWCQKNSTDIINKANVLYNLYKSGDPFQARARCLDFQKLEEVCRKYNAQK